MLARFIMLKRRSEAFRAKINLPTRRMEFSLITVISAVKKFPDQFPLFFFFFFSSRIFNLDTIDSKNARFRKDSMTNSYERKN